MQKLITLYNLYKPQGLMTAFVNTLRILILPFWKIDKALPRIGYIVDIGCGAGGMTNYLAIGSPKRELLGVDTSNERIHSALKSIGKRKNINFKLGDITRLEFKKSNNFLIVDVLHHISYSQQNKLLSYLSNKLSAKSILVIKDVDTSNKLPFLFGHFWEKILYPHQQINVRSRKQWLDIFKKLGLTVKILTGSPLFPDSTLIFVCQKK